MPNQAEAQPRFEYAYLVRQGPVTRSAVTNCRAKVYAMLTVSTVVAEAPSTLHKVTRRYCYGKHCNFLPHKGKIKVGQVQRP
jgi:hypothetical protein